MSTVAIDARKLADFGIGTYLRGLVRGLAELDRETRYVLLAPRARRALLADLPPNFEWMDESSPGYSLREQFALASTLARLSPDLFHSPHYVLPARTPVRTVVTIHDLIHLVHPEFLPSRMARPYARFMLRRAARRARRVLTVSHATARDLRETLGIAADRIVAVWNGVDEIFRRPLPGLERDRKLAALDLAPGYFLFVGNPKPHKNLPRLLEAFARTPSSDARLVVVGGRPEVPETLERRVVRLGRLEDAALPALYAGAKALLFPSLYEGFGLPVAEAMAMGTPVVASSTPAVAEIAGDAAWLVDPLDVDAWCEAIGRLDADPEKQAELAAAGKARSARFSWIETARRTLETYREVLAEPVR